MSDLYVEEGYKRVLEKEFEKVVTPNFFGFIRKEHKHYSPFDLEELVKQGRDRTPRNGWVIYDLHDTPFYVKKLGNSELAFNPPKRFVNSILLYNHNYNNVLSSFPRPIGIIYSGDGTNILTRDSKAYFIADYIKGNTLLPIIKDKNKLKSLGMPFDTLLELLTIGLKNLREKGIFLLDFAPRDIVIEDKELGVKHGNFWLVDTEHVKYETNYNYENLKKEQIAQFRKDYSGLITQEEIKKAVEILREKEEIKN